MRIATLMAATALISMMAAASAQTSATPAPAPKNAPIETSRPAGPQQQITSDLHQAGFTDVKVTPDSFLVQAKDKRGNPVTMFVNPNSFMEVTDIGADGQNANTGSAAGEFASIPSTDELSSKVVGLDVYNKSNQDIGTIKDLAFNRTGLTQQSVI